MKTIDLIITIVAVIALVSFLARRKTEREVVVVPLDSYGVPIEPNQPQVNEAMADISSLI